MDRKVLAPIPLWLTVLHGLMLVLALVVIAMPEARNVPVRIVLTALFFFAGFRSVLRLKRAGGLKTPISELSRHLPAGSFAESIATISITVAGFTQALAF